MSQGFGLSGGKGYCFRFYEEYVNCIREKGKHDGRRACLPQKEDYMECLHHIKQRKRYERIKAEKKRLIQEGKYPAKVEGNE